MSNIAVESNDTPWPTNIQIQRETSGIWRWFRAFRARRKAYRQAFFELSSCTDRDLKDLGIARSDINRIAHEASQLATSL